MNLRRGINPNTTGLMAQISDDRLQHLVTRRIRTWRLQCDIGNMLGFSSIFHAKKAEGQGPVSKEKSGLA